MQSGLDAIFNGVKESENDQEKSTKATSENISVCFRCSADRMSKIRTIAREKGVSLKDVMEAAIDLAIERYEKNNGVIEIRPLRGDKASIFD